MEPSSGDVPSVTAVEQLQRWESSGGTWQVLRRTSSALEIVLLTCDGGEEMGRIASSDPELRARVGDRSRSDE